jgi:hypothetical protein
MTGKEAEQTLSVIRTLMERSTCYTNLSGHAGIAAGLLTLVGCGLRVGLHTPFIATWMGVLVATVGAVVFFTASLAHSNGEPIWTRQARTVVCALLPGLAAALVLTLVLTRIGQQSILPGVWMLLWGVGALAMSFFTPRVISILGGTFLAAGTVVLMIPSVDDALSMGLTFGAIHLAYGIVLACARQSSLVVNPISLL